MLQVENLTISFDYTEFGEWHGADLKAKTKSITYQPSVRATLRTAKSKYTAASHSLYTTKKHNRKQSLARVMEVAKIENETRRNIWVAFFNKYGVVKKGEVHLSKKKLRKETTPLTQAEIKRYAETDCY